jgi:hypothetical protein
MKGYKAFNRVKGCDKSGMCRGMLFEEGEIYETTGKLKICSNGLHFCEYLVQTFEYYKYDHSKTIYAEVEAIGDLDVEDLLEFKYATNKLKVVKFLTQSEVEAMFSDDKRNTGNQNTGDWNTGNRNTGNWNTGNRNTGDWNTGNWNTGNRNTGNWNTGNWNTGGQNTGNRNTGNRNTGNWSTGDWNTGNRNTGDWNTGGQNTGNRNTGNWNTGDWNTGFLNTGDWNTGNRNTGDWNTGNWNTGDWNTGGQNTGNRNTGNRNTGDWNTSDRNTGFFNTKPISTILVFNVETSLDEWGSCEKPNFVYFNLVGCGDYKKSFIASFNKTTKSDVELLLKLPNFDYKVFEEISGISEQMIMDKLSQ